MRRASATRRPLPCASVLASVARCLLVLLATAQACPPAGAIDPGDTPAPGPVAGSPVENDRPGRPLAVRIEWGGGTPRAWAGTIAVLPIDDAAGAPLPFEWRTLSTEPDAAALVHRSAEGIVVHQSRPLASDGIEIVVADWHRARIVARLGPAVTRDTTATLDAPIVDLLAGPLRQPLDTEGNRLTARPAPGESLAVRFVDPAGGPPTAIHRPGDVLRLQVDPLLPVKPGEGTLELRVRLVRARDDRPLESLTVPLEPRTAAAAQVGDRITVPCATVRVEIPLPASEGVHEVVLEAVERTGLRWSRTVAARTVQVVTLATEPAPRPPPADWRTVHELDPGSPRLHERLRRLPARGLSAMPLPAVNLPAMPLPSLTREGMQLPRMPSVQLPSVPLPDVSGIVPRLGGLLATGHSVVIPHALGPMLRLPPAASSREPSWEAVLVTAAEPGLPHAVEIEFPSDQRAIVAACVLEADGGVVEPRHAGGFEVAASPYDGPPRLERHRFVFWPTTRQPLVVIANPATDTPALVGRIRVLAGPARLPPAAARGPVATAARAGRPRRTFAILPGPDLERSLGGPPRPATDGGRAVVDWVTHLAAAQQSADLLASQGVAGVVLPIYADGAATWPTETTRSAPRWHAASTGEAALDAAPKDLLAATVTLHARAGLAVIPALSFDAPIPTLQAQLATGRSAGIACIGPDGRPRGGARGPHYNVLDPRVQEAVEAIVVEAAGRLRGAPLVEGLAILLSDDGWLHLPGVPWPLDDATFSRFLAATGAADVPAGDARFAARAELVEGPLRRQWLDWRTAELAAFQARLAARLGACDDRWRLYVVPTTLLAAGDIAARLRPTLTDRPPSDDLLREIGLPPAGPLAAGPRAPILVRPHVHAPGFDHRERAQVAAANDVAVSDPVAATAAGVVLVERPLSLDLSAVVPHAPFGTAAAPAALEARILAAGPAADRSLAEAVVAGDAGFVFDMRPAVAASSPPPASRSAHEALPDIPLELAESLPAPLVVRSAAADGVTWMQAINASPAPAVATLTLAGGASTALDAVAGGALPLVEGRLEVPLPPWGVRTLVADGGARVAAVAVVHDEATKRQVAARLERLRRRLAVLERPTPLDVLDNPGFELAVTPPVGGHGNPTVTGWELVEPRRGTLAAVPGLAGPETAGRGLEFSSRHGLSTLRSNPFAAPVTGRVSVATWLRINESDPQPPLRIAIEGIEDGREYYRFAGIGGVAGGRPLTAEWSLFVLQVDDLPVAGIESLRVRLDLLGPGSVQLDDVRVFDLAFDAEERVRLAREIAGIDHRYRADDIGAAVVGLEGRWPEFLEAFVPDAVVPPAAAAAAPPAAPAPRQGVLDRVRTWWQ